MRRDSFSALLAVSLLTFAAILFTGMLVCPARLLAAQNKPPDWSGEERLIALQLKGLRKLPDDVRASTTKDLALQIRELRATPNKLRLAVGPASLSTEGDFGHDTLQEVATTLAAALRGSPPAAGKKMGHRRILTWSWPPWCAMNTCRRRWMLHNLPQPWRS